VAVVHFEPDLPFILNRIGRGANTLKIRPPMPFSIEHADLLADALQAALDAAPIKE